MTPSGETSRPLWPGTYTFLAVALTFVIDPSNLWRFPYLMYRNGGAVFLIPYVVFTLFLGIPLLFLQVSLGQYSNKDALACRKSVPVFKGVGYGLLVTNILTTLYYNVLCGLVCRYFFASLTSGALPWASCDNSWNTVYCVDGTEVSVNGSMGQYLISTTAAEEYFKRYILGEHLSDGVFDFASFRWGIALCCLCSVALVFICLSFDVRSFGLLAYVFCLLPFPLLIMLLIRGVSLPGSNDAIFYLITPRFDRLLQPQVWIDACLQVYYSLSIAGSAMITLASFNRFRNRSLRDVVLVCFFDMLVGLLGGVIVFSFVCYLAHEKNVDVDSLTLNGLGTAFYTFPEVLARLPLPAVWSAAFYLLLIVLISGTMVCSVLNIATQISEQLKIPQRFKVLITAAVCSAIFLGGLIMCASNGMYIFRLLDESVGVLYPLLGCLECLSIGWFYGAPRLSDDCRIMLGCRPSICWKILACIFWWFLCPLQMLALTGMLFLHLTPPVYGDYMYPDWVIYTLWSGLLLIAMIVPAYALFYILRHTSGTCRQRLKQMVQPTEDWVPTTAKHRRLVDYTKTYHADKWRYDEDQTALRLMNRKEPLGVSQTDGLNN